MKKSKQRDITPKQPYVKILSRFDLIQWINDESGIMTTSIPELRNGHAYLTVMTKLYPHDVKIKSIKKNAKSHYDMVHNLNLLQGAFNRLKINKTVKFETMNYDFLYWFHSNFAPKVEEKSQLLQEKNTKSQLPQAGKPELKSQLPQEEQSEPNLQLSLTEKEPNFNNELSVIEKEPNFNYELSVIEKEPNFNHELSVIEKEPNFNHELSANEEEPNFNHELTANEEEPNFNHELSANEEEANPELNLQLLQEEKPELMIRFLREEKTVTETKIENETLSLNWSDTLSETSTETLTETWTKTEDPAEKLMDQNAGLPHVAATNAVAMKDEILKAIEKTNKKLDKNIKQTLCSHEHIVYLGGQLYQLKNVLSQLLTPKKEEETD